MTSGKKCNLNPHLSNTKRHGDKFLPVNVKPPQGISEVISGLRSTCLILQRCRTSWIPRTLRPKSVSSAWVLFPDMVKRSEERRDSWSPAPFTIVERSVLPFNNSLDLQGLLNTGTGDGSPELPRNVTHLPLWRDILRHSGLDRRAFT